MVTLVAYPRLHLGLLDCGYTTSRKFGGIGFSVSGMRLRVSVELNTGSGRRHVLDGLFEALDEGARSGVLTVLERLGREQELPMLTVTLDSAPPQHVGLGTKTTLLLAVLRCAAEIAGVPLRETDLQRLSGRGGASGVGLSTFFTGGLVVDLGHRRVTEEGHLPSGASHPRAVPPLATRVPMPANWMVSLALADDTGLSGAAEVSFFAENTPIDDDEVYRAVTAAYHEVLPAAIEADIDAFSRGVGLLQSTGFKKREIKAQSDRTKLLLKSLQDLPGVAGGMSSMGPLVFAVHDSSNAASVGLVRDTILAHGASIFGSFSCRNDGYELL